MDRAFEKEPRLRKDSVLFLKEASRMMEERNESIDKAFVTLRRLCTTCHAFARILSNQDTFLTHLQIFYDECNRDETRSLILALVHVAISSNPHARESFDVDSTLYKTYRNVYGGSSNSKTSSASSWTCPACTYKNTKNSSKCEMCETSRPAKAIESKEMKNRTTAPSSSWTGKQPMNRSRRDDDYDDDDDDEEKQNAELTRRILSVYNAYDDDGEDDDAIFGSGFSIGMENKNHGDQAKTQSERILRDAEDRERAALMAEAPVKIAALHEELERLGPNDREAIKSIRKQIERWKTLCIPTSTEKEEEESKPTKTTKTKTKTKNTTSNRDKNGLPIRYTRADGKKKGSSSRRRKNQNKASVGNHNRKNRAARKRK